MPGVFSRSLQRVSREWWWLSYLILFLICFIVFFTLQASPYFADPDSFYHAKMALLIRDHGVVRDFPWLNLTVLGQAFTDQHFLYHVLLIPFVSLGPPLIGLKLATVFFGASLITVAYWMMRQFNVRWAFAYALILLFIRPFSFRISLAKAPSTSLIFLLVGLTWIFQYRLRRLFVLAYTYVLYYGGFPLLGVAAALYVAVSMAHNRWITRLNVHRFIQKIYSLIGRQARHDRRRRLNLRLLIVVAGGIAAGLVINPYFPQNLIFYYHQLYDIGVVNFQHVIGVGGEWYPYAFSDLVANGVFASILIVLALVGMMLRFRAQSKQSFTLFLLTAFFFVLTLKSRRYVEYYIPIAVLFAAFSLSDSLKDGRWEKLRHELADMFFRRTWSRAVILVLSAMIIFAVGYIGGRDFQNERHDLQSGFPVTRFAAVGAWLAANTPAGSRVVHSNWDEFPMLFYYDDHNAFVAGLDPTFLYKANANVYWTWVNITLGKYTGDVYDGVTKTLGSSYVLVASGHDLMDRYFSGNKLWRLRYQDSEAKVYEAVRRTP